MAKEVVKAGKKLRKLNWVLEDGQFNLWKLFLVGGLIEISIWDGRLNPILWPYFDGFRCQINGEKTIDLTFPGVVDTEEAKRLAVSHFLNVMHQIGAELSLWPKEVDVPMTGESVLFQVTLKLK